MYTAPRVQVYLAPGFFGFTQLGGLRYFHRVADVLGEEPTRLGCEAEIIEVDTKATSSIRRRALALCQDVEVHGGLEHDRLHFVGHSTGGLDVRLERRRSTPVRTRRTAQIRSAAAPATCRTKRSGDEPVMWRLSCLLPSCRLARGSLIPRVS